MLCYVAMKKKKIVTKFYQKLSNPDVYLNWNSSALHKWKRGTLTTLTQPANMICSKQNYWTLKHLKTYFSEKNSYPNCLIRHVFAQFKFINDSSLSPYTIETIQVLANANETMTYVTSTLSIRQRQWFNHFLKKTFKSASS